jgi:hypothetical protein
LKALAKEGAQAQIVPMKNSVWLGARVSIVFGGKRYVMERLGCGEWEAYVPMVTSELLQVLSAVCFISNRAHMLKAAEPHALSRISYQYHP